MALLGYAWWMINQFNRRVGSQQDRIIEAAGPELLPALESFVDGDTDLYHDHPELYQRLFNIFYTAMPHDMATGDVGGAEEWIADYTYSVFAEQ